MSLSNSKSRFLQDLANFDVSDVVRVISLFLYFIRIPMAGLMVSPAGVPAGHESLEDHDGVISSPARPISTADDVMMMLSDTEEAPASVEVPLFLCSENQEVKMDT